MIHRLLCFSLFILTICASTYAAPLTLGDSGVAIRSDPQTIDVDATVKQLDAMHCNTYCYDLPHGTDAWDKLPAFLDAAAAKQIDVYVWLEPWTLALRNDKDESSEPFGTDFVRWFSEVGALSANQPNLVGIVMDDFTSNTHQPDHFTPELLKSMLDAGHAKNPRLKFKPILYFNDPLDELMDRFGSQFRDGVIVCYPRSERELRATIPFFIDGDRGASLDLEFPKRHRLKPGEGTFAVAQLDRELASHAKSLAFFFDDQNPTNKRGRHRVVVRVGEKDVWDQELASESMDDDVRITLPELRGGERVSIGVISDEPTEEASVRIRLVNIRFENEAGKRLPKQPRWVDRPGNEISFQVSNAHEGEHRWNLPMTLMVAGAQFEDKKRFDEEGSPKQIAKRLGDAIAWSKKGLADGVILFWTPKDDQSPLPHLVADAFGGAK